MEGKKLSSDAYQWMYERYIKDDPEAQASLKEIKVQADLAGKVYDIRTRLHMTREQLAGGWGLVLRLSQLLFQPSRSLSDRDIMPPCLLHTRRQLLSLPQSSRQDPIPMRAGVSRDRRRETLTPYADLSSYSHFSRIMETSVPRNCRKRGIPCHASSPPELSLESSTSSVSSRKRWGSISPVWHAARKASTSSASLRK